MNLEAVAERAPEVETVSSLSLKGRIERFLKNQFSANGEYAWINGGEIERLALLAQYKASNASRRLRELYVEGVIERRENVKGHAEYRYASK